MLYLCPQNYLARSSSLVTSSSGCLPDSLEPLNGSYLQYNWPPYNPITVPAYNPGTFSLSAFIWNQLHSSFLYQEFLNDSSTKWRFFFRLNNTFFQLTTWATFHKRNPSHEVLIRKVKFSGAYSRTDNKSSASFTLYRVKKIVNFHP